jgi:hypothetical protein
MVRDSISTFSKVGNIDSELAQLERDISSGEWGRRYSSLQNLSALDLGYRIVIANKRRPYSVAKGKGLGMAASVQRPSPGAGR